MSWFWRVISRTIEKSLETRGRSDAATGSSKNSPPYKGGVADASSDGVVLSYDAPHARHLSKNQRTQLEKRIKQIELEIPTLEDKAAKFTLEMAKPNIASDFEKLNALTKQLRETEKKIQDLYAEWETASAQLL